MESCYVIGCTSLQLSADGIKVFREGGVMSITWSDVRLATLGGINDYSHTMQLTSIVMGGRFGSIPDMMRIARDSQATILHTGPGSTPREFDALWIAHRGGTVLAYIEPDGPKRDQLVTDLRTRLGPLWLGGGVASGMARSGAIEYVVPEPVGRTLEKPVNRVEEKRSGCPLGVLGCIATVACIVFYGPLFFFGFSTIFRTANRKLVGLFSAGGWRPAIFLGTVFSLVALIYWVRKNSA